MKLKIAGGVAFCMVLLSACATPGPRTGPDAVVETLRWIRGHDERVQSVSWRLATSNVALCGGNVSPVLGAEFWSAASFDPKARKYAIAAFGISDQPTAAYVIPGSPAAQAGLRSGHEIIAVGEVPLPAGEDGLKLFAAEAARMAKGNTVSLDLTIRDEAGLKRLAMSSVLACRISVGLLADRSVNALTDGRTILVTTGLLQFARSDAELATVIGHEIAHGILRHPEAMQSEALARSFGLALDIMVSAATGIPMGTSRRLGAMRRSTEREIQADYVGTYLAARAGYATLGIERIWQRLADEHPEALEADLSHPDLPRRFAAMEATSREIEEKKNRKKPLLPNGMVPATQ